MLQSVCFRHHVFADFHQRLPKEILSFPISTVFGPFTQDCNLLPRQCPKVNNQKHMPFACLYQGSPTCHILHIFNIRFQYANPGSFLLSSLSISHRLLDRLLLLKWIDAFHDVYDILLLLKNFCFTMQV